MRVRENRVQDRRWTPSPRHPLGLCRAQPVPLHGYAKGRVKRQKEPQSGKGGLDQARASDYEPGSQLPPELARRQPTPIEPEGDKREIPCNDVSLASEPHALNHVEAWVQDEHPSRSGSPPEFAHEIRRHHRTREHEDVIEQPPRIRSVAEDRRREGMHPVTSRPVAARKVLIGHSTRLEHPSRVVQEPLIRAWWNRCVEHAGTQEGDSENDPVPYLQSSTTHGVGSPFPRNDMRRAHDQPSILHDSPSAKKHTKSRPRTPCRLWWGL